MFPSSFSGCFLTSTIYWSITRVLPVPLQNVHIFSFQTAFFVDCSRLVQPHNPNLESLHSRRFSLLYSSGRCSSGKPEIIDSLTVLAYSTSVLPSDSTGSCTTTLQIPLAGLYGNIQYDGMTSAALQMDMGITGLPALCAILNAPFLKGISRPDRDRVPSGKVHRLTPSYFGEIIREGIDQNMILQTQSQISHVRHSYNKTLTSSHFIPAFKVNN